MLMPPIHKLKKVILGFFLSFVLFIIGGAITIFILGTDYLTMDDSPPPSTTEAIIVLSGNIERLEHGAELFRNGGADHMILTNSTENGTTKKEAISLGVPGQAIIEEPSAQSTYENAKFSMEVIKEEDFESAIVVTSDYHSRRTKMTFDDIYDEEADLYYSFADSGFASSDGLSEQEKMITFSEYAKIIGYSFRLLFE